MRLSPDELATRIVYIAARCVDYAANEKKSEMSIRIEQGDKLLQALEDWYQILPSSFKPIYTLPPSETSLFSPVWIHPASFAAAVQMFHFARIVVLINQPSVGGMSDFRQRQKCLDESVETICGIALVDQGKDLPSAFCNFQALFAGMFRSNSIRNSLTNRKRDFVYNRLSSNKLSFNYWKRLWTSRSFLPRLSWRILSISGGKKLDHKSVIMESVIKNTILSLSPTFPRRPYVRH